MSFLSSAQHWSKRVPTPPYIGRTMLVYLLGAMMLVVLAFFFLLTTQPQQQPAPVTTAAATQPIVYEKEDTLLARADSPTTTTSSPPPTTTTRRPSPTTTAQKPQEAKPVARSRAGGDPTSDATWDRLAGCEATGDWHANTGNGYSGGLQWSPSSWESWRNPSDPAHAWQASREQQIAAGKRYRSYEVAHGRGGYGPWPGCARQLGLPQ